MNLAKKITQILSLILLIALASSCKRQCFTTDEFEVSNASVDSYPTVDGINGTDYDPVTGGQVANWHDTGLKSNGDMFLIRISGAWTPWNAGKYNSMTESQLNALPVCNFCAKKDPSNPNCICYAKQNVVAEQFQKCDSKDLDQQNNPNLCSCTKDPQYGTALDYGTYHFPLNYFDKSETTKIADKQSACKYIAGMGAYIGLFGRNGVSDPSRLYHLFVDNRIDEDGAATKVCDINLNSNGECKDSSGTDRTAYVFKSANKRIFMKDDGDGNTGVNTDTSNDVYHGPNEVVKLKIFDLYYNDNYGRYNVDILKGVGDNSDLSSLGLLEYLVRMVEDILLGKLEPVNTLSQDENGNTVTTTTYKRVDGVIKFMYNAIVQDSGFVLFLNVTLSLYIAFYGVAVLLGTVEINKKELMNRLVKISLVIFFTNAASWNFYNEIIVGFFYDSMNYLVSMLMSLSDASLSKGMDTSAIVIAQMDRAVDVSNSTRFSYIDSSIKMMLSQGFAGKVFSLPLSDLFGIIYAILIYLLVGYFIYVMLIAASMYLVNIIKLIFVLCLGPIFISFVLFNQTNSMFKNWLAFLGARSLEVVLIFAILYNFVMLIDAGFRDLLAFEACVEPFSFGGMFSINILKASGIGDRNVVTWLTSITKIAALIFITQLILNKVAEVAGHLITVGGVANKNADGVGHGQSGMTLAGAGGNVGGGGVSGSELYKEGGANALGGGMFGQLMSAGASAVSTSLSLGTTGAMYAGKGASAATRALGIDKALSKLGDYNLPMKFARETARNAMLIDPIIKQAQKDALSQKNAAGKPLSKAETEQFVRAQTFAKLSQQNQQEPIGGGPKGSVYKPLQSTLLGLSHDKIAARLDQKLIHEPAQKFLKEEGGKLREQGLYGKDLQNSLKASLTNWAKDNLGSNSASELNTSLGKKGNDRSLTSFERSLKSQIKSEGRMPNSQAARLFANNPEKQQKYLQYLQDQAAKRDAKNKDAAKGGFGAWANNMASRGLDGIARVTGFETETRNPNVALQSFVRNLSNEERSGGIFNRLALNPLNRSNLLDRSNPFSSLNQRTEDVQKLSLRNYLEQDHPKPKALPTLSNKPTAKEKKDYKEALRKAGKEDEKRAFFQSKLQELATKDLVKKVGEIAKLERRGKKEDAAKAKSALLRDAQKALIMSPDNKDNFRKDGLTLFEKAARLDYLQKQFGITGDNSLKTLSGAIKEGIKKGTQDLEKKVGTGSKTKDLGDEINNLKLLKSGLLTSAINDKEFDALASTLKDKLELITQPKEPVVDSLKNGQLPEDKKALAEENKEINKNKKEGQEELVKLDEKLKAVEAKFEKEQKEKEEEEKYQQARKEALKEQFKLVKQIAESKDIVEIKQLEQNLRDKFATEVEATTKHQIAKLGKEVDTAIANKSPEESKKLAEEISELLASPINKPASDSVIKGLEASNIGITGSAADLALQGDILKTLLQGSAANALLGASSTPETGPLTEAQKKELGMHKNQVGGQLKLNNMNLKLKQFELTQLKANKGDASQIAQLESEVADLTKEIGRLEREEEKIEDVLK